MHKEAQFVFSSFPQILEYARPYYFTTPVIFKPVRNETIEVDDHMKWYLNTQRNPRRKNIIVLAFGFHFNWRKVPNAVKQEFSKCFVSLDDYTIIWQYSDIADPIMEHNYYQWVWLPLEGLMQRKNETKLL